MGSPSLWRSLQWEGFFLDEAEWFCSKETDRTRVLSLPGGSSFPPLVLHIKSLKRCVSSDQLPASPRAPQSRKHLNLTSIPTQSFQSAMFTPDFASHLQFCHKQCLEVTVLGKLRWFVMELCDWGAHRTAVPMRVHTPLPSSVALQAPHHHPCLSHQPCCLQGTGVTMACHLRTFTESQAASGWKGP